LQKTPEWVIILLISRIGSKPLTTKINPTGVRKDEEKTRKKQGEKTKDNWYRNYQGHVDVTGRFEFICSIPDQYRDNALYSADV